MENKTKVIIFLFLSLFAILSACNRQCTCTQQGIGYAWHSDPIEGKVLHVIPYTLMGEKYEYVVKSVKMNGKLYPLSDVVDCKSFINIYDSEDSVARRNNEYYRINPIVNYFKDKNYLYFYIEQEKPPYDDFLTVMGKCDDYEVLGGEYLRVGDKIYSRGVEVAGADLASFHTIEVLRKYSEWQAILGKDKNHIYLYDKPMTKSQSEGFIIDSSLLFSDGESATIINKYLDYNQFENAVLWYLDSGEIYLGSSSTSETEDDHNLSLIDELQRPEEGEVEDTWLTQIPSTLTIIQARSAYLEDEDGLPCDCDNLLFESSDQHKLQGLDNQGLTTTAEEGDDSENGSDNGNDTGTGEENGDENGEGDGEGTNTDPETQPTGEE